MKNHLIQLASFLLLICLAGVAAASAQSTGCYNYQKKDNTISGTVKRTTIKKETIWVLALAEKACFVSDPADEINTPEEGLTDLQLVLTPDEYSRYRSLLNKRVLITGEFFRWHTAHHYTRVLLDVEKIETETR